MKIYVDADACPVIDQIMSISTSYSIPVVLVKSFSHYSPEQIEGAEVIYVDKGTDVADFRIIHLARREDIVITQDYGLASLCLAKGCKVLHHKGFRYTSDNIDSLLHSRHASAIARRSGHRTKGPKPFTNEDKEAFSYALEQIIEYTEKRSAYCG